MFIDAIHSRAVRDPNGLAAVTEQRRVTNAAMWDEIASLAAWLMRSGLVSGDVVGISVKDEYRHLLTSLAAMLADLPQIALPTYDPPEAREVIARRVGVKAVLADDESHALASFPVVFPDFEYRATDEDPGWHFARRAIDDVCLYLTSSGTTGRAKLIPLGQAELYHQAMTAQLTPERHVVYWQAPIEFNNSKRHRLYGQATGATNVMLGTQHAVPEVCREFRVTRLGLSAAQARRLLSSPSGDIRLPPNTEVQLRGSPVSDELRRNILQNMSPKLVVGYGAAEIGSITTVATPDFKRHPATLGVPNVGVELQIVGDGGELLPPGSRGAVRVRSAGMASRYHDNPEETARNFRSGWFYPGDIGSMGDAGDFRFDGRADDMMVLTSINIFPAEIEYVADALPGVVESAAFAVKSAEFGDIPVLAVVGDGTVKEAEILLRVRNALGVRAPRRVILVDAIPRNEQGKVMRSELQRLVAARNNQKAVA